MTMHADPMPHSPALRAAGVSPSLVAALTALGLASALAAWLFGQAAQVPAGAMAFMIGWLALSTACSALLTPRSFVLGFLGALLGLLFGWRIAGFYGVAWVWAPLLAAFMASVWMFFASARADLRAARPALSRAEWHLALLRLYVGFDMVPHSAEKLFAGPAPFMDDVKAFAGMGLPWPEAFVVVGGLCELGIAIGIGMGVLTRLAALGATLYFLIATLAGGHFGLGFIWASPGGGWEYPVLMMVIYLSFAWRGAGRFSVDGEWLASGRFPAALRVLVQRRGSTVAEVAAPHRAGLR